MENLVLRHWRKMLHRIDSASVSAVCAAVVMAISGTGCANFPSADHSIQTLGSSGEMAPDSDIYLEIKQPTSQEEFLKNVKVMVDHDLLIRRDFYTNENMLKFFAARNGSSGVEPYAKKIRTWFITNEFDGIFSHFWEGNYLMPDAQLSTGINFEQGGEIIGRFNFNIQKELITIDDVKKVFDGELVMDKTIPFQPPPLATGAHGNEEWKYRQENKYGQIVGYFRFNGDGRLGGIFLEEKWN